VLNRSFALQANIHGEANSLLVQDNSSTLLHTSAQIASTPDYGDEDKTTIMMANMIPLVMKDVMKVQNFEGCMLTWSILPLPIGCSITLHMSR